MLPQERLSIEDTMQAVLGIAERRRRHTVRQGRRLFNEGLLIVPFDVSVETCLCSAPLLMQQYRKRTNYKAN
jgi:hypothetical protein